MINTVNQGMERKFVNGGRLKVIEHEPADEKRDRQNTDREG